jgi:hypothetical protein
MQLTMRRTLLLEACRTHRTWEGGIHCLPKPDQADLCLVDIAEAWVSETILLLFMVDLFDQVEVDDLLQWAAQPHDES